MHVVGASGRSGAALCRSLLADGVAFVPVVRSAARWAATGLPGEPRLADLADAAAMPGKRVAHAASAGVSSVAYAASLPGEPRPGDAAGARLRAALAGATHVVSCAHARHAATIIEAAPVEAVLVFIGSTRKYTAWPDDHGRGVLAGEAAFLASGRRGVMLHPTMIYGAQGEDNVQRLAALLRRLPILPLPDGGRALVQPIHQDDVTRCVRAALRVRWPGAETMVIAGPAPVAYADFVRAVSLAAGLAPRRILNVPVTPLRWAAKLSGLWHVVPRIDPAELQRLGEDKDFDVSPMRTTLGVTPVALSHGLGRIDWRR